MVVDALPGRVFRGNVVRLAPFFDPTTRTLDAEVQLPNADGTLRPGMYGRGSIILARHEDATVLPAAAMQISGNATLRLRAGRQPGPAQAGGDGLRRGRVAGSDQRSPRRRGGGDRRSGRPVRRHRRAGGP